MFVSPANPAEAGSSPAPEIDGSAAARTAGLPQVGQCWRGIYQVLEAADEAGATRWRALRIDIAEEVILRISRADPIRAQVWQCLETIECESLVRVYSRTPVGNVFVEASALPAGCSLREWKSREPADTGSTERLLRPLAAAVAALHERGLGHFAIRPEHVFVREEHGAMHVMLGGFDHVTLLEQPGLIPIAVDPLHAPPEAAGLFQHPAGETLRAWDWWSIGRVLQERMLGRHVLGHILQRDVSRATPELLARAEALLLERQGGGTRAGAVEAMPAMDKRLELLLRGLLTTARDARWGAEQIGRWMRGEPVKEHYRLPRNERMFRWKNRAYTLAEVAGEFRSATHADEAMEQLWTPDRAGTLAHFLGEVPALRGSRDKLDELKRLSEAAAVKSFPPEVVREAITAIAVLEFAGAPLTWRGHDFTHDGLAKLLAGDAANERLVMLVQVLATRTLVLLIERCDPDAARLLSEFAQVATAAEALLRQQRWLKEGDDAGLSRLFVCALRHPSELRQAWKALHDRFACSTDLMLDKLFKHQQPTPAEIVAIIWMGERAASFGFVGHEEWARRECARLRSIGEGLARALFWVRLRRALAAGPVVFRSWLATIGVGAALAMGAAAIWPGPRWLGVALGPLAILMILRGVAVVLLRARVRRAQPDAAAWRWRDGYARAKTEAETHAGGRTAGTLIRALQTVNRDIAGLDALKEKPAALKTGSETGIFWAVAIAGWLVAMTALAVEGGRVTTHRPSLRAFVHAWSPPPHPPADAVAAPDVANAPPAEKKAELAEVERGPVKVSWPFKPGDVAQVLLIKDSVEARGDQTRFAIEQGRKLAEPYKPETISTLVILRVPTTEGIGVMIYDAQKQQLANARVYLINYPPMARAWVEVAGRSGIYLPD